MAVSTEPRKAPVTPDGRYFVVRGRLWRCSNPALDAERRKELVQQLMQARSAKGRAMRAGDGPARESARAAVDAAKHALGERGAPWWTDGAPDYNRRLAKSTPYAEWFAQLERKVEHGTHPDDDQDSPKSGASATG